MLPVRSLLLACLLPCAAAFAGPAETEMYWGAVHAPDKFARSALVNEGFSIEAVKSDTVYGFAPASILEQVARKGFTVEQQMPVSEIRAFDFPADDSAYHTYDQMKQELDALAAAHPTLVHSFTIGKSREGRELYGVRISAHATDGLTPSSLPGAVFMGGHHAREHLSVEVPLLLAHYLAESTDETVKHLVDTRDVFIIPMVNPDGAAFDISTGSYQMWRKNRTPNAANASCPGVDVNRNYGFAWGTGGSSTNPCSEVYMGPQAFSEPESQAVKAFVEGHPNLKVLLTFHTFSELVLYPWGHTYDKIANAADQSTFEKMAHTMAGWNGYTPEPTNELYIASGDTTDWAYGALGIFAFTFEMSPNGNDSWGGGGFYPGVPEIQHSFQANLKPALYMIDLADNPHRAVTAPATTLFYGQK